MTTYFRRLVPGAAHSRYFIGDMADTGIFYVTRTQISRPDGQEIREPRRVTVLASAPSTPTPLRKRVIDAADHRRNARELQPKLDRRPEQKQCAKCKQEKHRVDFYAVVRRGVTTLHSYCRTCMVEINRAKRAPIADARRAA